MSGEPTAQNAFKVLVQTRIAPALREMGFRGSGSTFQLASASHWALVGFQRSQFSSAEDVRFTVNLTVVEREAWSEARQERRYLPERPAANTFYGSWLWQSRIGSLLPSGEDRWWAIGAGSEGHRVAEEVIRAIRDYGLPAMARQMGQTGDS